MPIDYSKLSNEDLLALKAGDYSKISNEGLLSLKQPSPIQEVPYTEELGKQKWEEMEKSGAFKGLEPIPGPITETLMLGIGGAPVAPKIAQVAVKGTKLVTKPISKLGKLISTPSLSKIGKKIASIEESKGIAVSGEAVNAPRTRKAILDWATKLKDLGTKAKQIEDPKTLNFIKNETGNILDFLKVAKVGAQPKQVVAKSTVARLAKIKEQATKALTEAVPELKKPFEQYGIAKSRQEILSQLSPMIPSFVKGPAKAIGSLGKYLIK